MARKQLDYANGKVYVVRNTENDKLYIGSTATALSKRMSKHRTASKSRNTPFYKAMREIGREKFYIELVEAFPCKSCEELMAREGHFIRHYDTFKRGYNNKIEGRTKAIYNEEHKEELKAYKNKYNEEHKDDRLDYDKQYYEANKDKVRQRVKKFQQENREAVNAYNRAYYQRKKQQL